MPQKLLYALLTVALGFPWGWRYIEPGEIHASIQDAVAMVPSLRVATIWSLASDGDALWAGAWLREHGNRLLRIDKAELSIRDESDRFQLQQGDTITELFVNGDVLWIGTNHNTWLSRPFRRSGEAVEPKEAGSYLSRWLSTFDELAPRCARTSLETFLDEGEFAWLAYFKGSVYVYEKSSGRCSEVFRPPSIHEWPTVLAGDERFVYIGTRGAGVAVVDRQTLQTIRLAATHPLLRQSRVINALAVDERRLWVGGDRGLIMVQKAWLIDKYKHLIFQAPLQAQPVRRLASSEAQKIISERAKEVIWAIKNRAAVKLSTLIHPDRGVRFSPYAYVDVGNDLVFTAVQVKSIFADKTKYIWGVYDGSGDPIKLTFEEYFQRFIYDRDFVNAKEIGYNRIIGRGNTTNNNFEVYPGAIIVEYHFPGSDPKYGGMDWESLRLVFEEKDSIWYLVGVIHDQWTI